MRPTYSSHAIASSSSSNGIAGQEYLEEEEAECPLCLDPLDISDVTFFPCPCGYQICSFCYNHIREHLNGRCPACRKPYDEADVQHKPIDPEEVKKYERAKKRRDKEKNRNETNVRKALTNVRVKQKTQAHIQGMTYRAANEDTIPLLKSQEWFGQYGKILKLFLAKRTNMPDSMSTGLDPRNTPVNIYINFATQREAATCITSVDGELTPDGQFKLRAGWGTTKYCPTYLRGQRCQQDNCMMAHETGEEVDPVGGAPGPVTREELSTLKHAMKEQESRDAQTNGRPMPNGKSATVNAPGLPASASWAKPSNGNSMPPPAPLNLVSPLSFPLPSSSKHSPSPSLSRPPKSAVHPLPARPPSREAHAAAAASAARSKHGSISGSIASTARRASASSSSDERSALPNRAQSPGPSAMRQSSLAVESSPGNTTQDHTSRSASPFSVATPSTNQYFYSPVIVDDAAEYENPLRSFASGPFAFDFNMDVGSSTKGKGKQQPDGLSSLNDDFLLGIVGSSLASGLPTSSALHRSDSEQGYTGTFDPFAEQPEEDQARPKASRFEFAKKGLFGSSDSLHTLGTRPLDNFRQNSMRSASPVSAFAATPPRSHSPQRALISPPPGLSSLWQAPTNAFSRSPVGPGHDLPGLARSSAAAFAATLPLSNAATQPLPPPSSASAQLASAASASLPPGLNSARQTLPVPLLPARHNLTSPPGLHKEEGFGMPLWNGHEQPRLSDPAILNMPQYSYPPPNFMPGPPYRIRM